MQRSLEQLVRDHDAQSNDMAVVPTESSAQQTVAQILEVLNTHHDSLSWLDSQSRKMQKEVTSVMRSIETVRTGSARI